MKTTTIHKWSFTQLEAERIVNKAKSEKYNTATKWYNSYIELTYNVPIDLANCVTFPQWSNVKSIKIIGGQLELTLGILPFEIYDFDICLNRNFINILL